MIAFWVITFNIASYNFIILFHVKLWQEFPNVFVVPEATSLSTSPASASVPSAFGDRPIASIEYVGLTSFGAAEHCRATASCGITAPFETAAPFGASSSVGRETPFEAVVGLPVARSVTPNYRGGRQKDFMISPEERRKRDNHNQGIDFTLCLIKQELDYTGWASWNAPTLHAYKSVNFLKYLFQYLNLKIFYSSINLQKIVVVPVLVLLKCLE